MDIHTQPSVIIEAHNPSKRLLHTPATKLRWTFIPSTVTYPKNYMEVLRIGLRSRRKRAPVAQAYTVSSRAKCKLQATNSLQSMHAINNFQSMHLISSLHSQIAPTEPAPTQQKTNGSFKLRKYAIIPTFFNLRRHAESQCSDIGMSALVKSFPYDKNRRLDLVGNDEGYAAAAVSLRKMCIYTYIHACKRLCCCCCEFAQHVCLHAHAHACMHAMLLLKVCGRVGWRHMYVHIHVCVRKTMLLLLLL